MLLSRRYLNYINFCIYEDCVHTMVFSVYCAAIWFNSIPLDFIYSNNLFKIYNVSQSQIKIYLKFVFCNVYLVYSYLQRTAQHTTSGVWIWIICTTTNGKGDRYMERYYAWVFVLLLCLFKYSNWIFWNIFNILFMRKRV